MDEPVAVELPAGAARLAADYLAQGARDAADAGDALMAECLTAASAALHAAGWGARS